MKFRKENELVSICTRNMYGNRIPEPLPQKPCENGFGWSGDRSVLLLRDEHGGATTFEVELEGNAAKVPIPCCSSSAPRHFWWRLVCETRAKVPRMSKNLGEKSHRVHVSVDSCSSESL